MILVCNRMEDLINEKGINWYRMCNIGCAKEATKDSTLVSYIGFNFAILTSQVV